MAVNKFFLELSKKGLCEQWKENLESILLSRDICIPKSNHTMQNYAMKTTGLMGEMGLGVQHSKPLSLKLKNEMGTE